MVKMMARGRRGDMKDERPSAERWCRRWAIFGWGRVVVAVMRSVKGSVA